MGSTPRDLSKKPCLVYNPAVMSALSPSPNRARLALYLFILAVAAVEIRGYHFGTSNQSIQVPLLKRALDPSLYPGDLLFTSFSGYPSFFFAALAPLVKAVGSVEVAYFGLFVIFEFLTLAALYALTNLAFGDGAGAVAACCLYMAGVECLGTDATTPSLLTHSSAVGALLLWTLFLYLAGRRVLAFGACGLLFNLHALYAGQVLALCVLDSLVDSEKSRRDLLKGLGLFFLLSLPTTVWLVRGGGIPPEMTSSWLAILRERSAFHAFPFSVGGPVYSRYLLFVALTGLAFVSLPRSQFHRAFIHFFLGVVFLCALGVIFSEWIPLVSVIRAQLLRITRWFTFLGLVYVGTFLVHSWRVGVLARLAALSCFLGIVLGQPGFLALGLGLYLLTQRGRFGLFASILTILALSLSVVTRAAPIQPFAILRVLSSSLKGLLLDPLALTSFALLLLAVWAQKRPRAFPFVVFFSLGSLLLLVLPAMYRKQRDALRSEPWSEVQTWVREHTPTDALILTPPDLMGFRVFSERPIVGEWKDGTQQFFSAPFAVEWHQRMTELGGLRRTYDGFKTDRLVGLGRTYGAKYLVCRRKQTVNLLPLFENSEYVVYVLPVPTGPHEMP
jgi:hypothetical protein